MENSNNEGNIHLKMYLTLFEEIVKRKGSELPYV